MQGAVLYGVHSPLQIEEIEVGEPDADQVRVRLLASGVCHSDWHVIKGDWPHIPLPCVLGHEGAGVVESLGPGIHDLAVGDHVTLSWRPNCGICEMCQRGYPSLCDVPVHGGDRPLVNRTGERVNRMASLGTFSHATIVPRSAVVAIPADVPFDVAALIGCGVMTGVGAVINTAQVEAGRSVAVFGCGGVGLNVIQGCKLVGADPIIAVDIRENKLEMARQFGATHTVNASQEDPVARIQAITGGGSHYAFEAIGLSGEPFRQAILCTRKRGVTVFVGHAPFDTPVNLDARMLMHEKMVIGSYYGTARPHVDFPRLIQLYRQGLLLLDELVTRRYALADVNEAFAALARGEVARSVLMME